MSSYRKKKIPKAIREQVWLTYNGKRYERKCYVYWCKNIIDVTINMTVIIDEIEDSGMTVENISALLNESWGNQGNV